MIYELRIYSVVPGRIDVSLNRFRNHLPALFARHGINNIGRWIVTAGPAGPSFIYMMAYDTLAQREDQWGGFYADPEWYSVRALTQGEEEATERYDIHFLRRSSVWEFSGPSLNQHSDGPADLLLIQTALGQTAAVERFLADIYLPLVRDAGARVVLVADMISGVALPKVAVLLSWPDAATRHAGWQSLAVHEDLRNAFAEQRKALGRTLLGRIDTYILHPDIVQGP